MGTSLIRCPPMGFVVPQSAGLVALGNEKITWSQIEALGKKKMTHKVHAFFRYQGNWYLFCSPSYVGYLAVFCEDDPPMTDAEINCIRCWKRYDKLMKLWGFNTTP